MDKNKRSIDVMIDTIINALKLYSPTLPFDKTVQGRITEVLTDNFYNVQINDGVFTIPSLSDMTYMVNENVWVTIIQNDNKNKVISGRRKK
ncbi:hypothetical protein [Sinanaerobacter chloroacetimidivorans]|uniref:Uncharacterized protein n=1 Tax=Sinanaerobacter chloroacetimidivorans TaxID=2818044 RepID=A0A8J8B0T6_9FIRM|nr:hypothetical protein [Sinanaerobacter chloroacetimidivorans]MBR0596966.1 hypothetical protein [Sinanaerobacter chloroacetimidivorans]